MKLKHSYLTKNLTNINVYKVFQLLDENKNEESTVSISQDEIARLLNIKQPSVSRSIKELEDLQVLYIGRSGNNNMYKINDIDMWKGFKDNSSFN